MMLILPKGERAWGEEEESGKENAEGNAGHGDPER
jgi:hypothetical protein